MIRAALRRWLNLPSPRCRFEIENEWVPCRDGTRLATRHIWPIDWNQSAPTLLIRTPYGIENDRGVRNMGSLLAEYGYHVIVQDVRGRYASEGTFLPFSNEAQDGSDVLEWIEKQAWHEGKIGLLGASYMAYCAWASLASSPEKIDAIVAMIGSGNLYSTFYHAGALQLWNTMEWGLSIGNRESVPGRRIDLPRALAHRPLLEADRVGHRRVPWVQDWISHPRLDAYWQELNVVLPKNPAPALLIAGWYDFFFRSQLDDFQTLVTRARETGAEPPRLVVGPWSHGLPARLGWWKFEMFRTALPEALSHFDRHLRDSSIPDAQMGIRYFLMGPDQWKRSRDWPPEAHNPRVFYLRANGEEPRLEEEPAEAEEPRCEFEHDPEDPHPTLGGPLLGWKAGVSDRRALAKRSDVAVYDSAPLQRDLELTGSVHLWLHASVDAEDADWVARLVDVASDGKTTLVTDGIQRARWQGVSDRDRTPHFSAPNTIREIEIEFTATARVFSCGHRIRLEISTADFPRFDRNPGNRESPGEAVPMSFSKTRHSIYHTPAMPSRIGFNLNE